ncbi:MAG TPA: CDP-alcohol phosphatidyltransferase family protein [Tepidisphaeraceae bacterium]|jgi:CDP-diacylglycerol--serine O-phosphatidyltransferase
MSNPGGPADRLRGPEEFHDDYDEHEEERLRPRRRRLALRHLTEEQREHRRRRIRRHGRRAYIRSVYSLPSLATLGNAICGFGAIYVSAMHNYDVQASSNDAWTVFLSQHQFLAAAYLIFVAMFFDALDGRLARFARHTTDFGGQLDSLADVISFGAAPAFLSLQLFLHETQGIWLPVVVTRTIWAIGALYMSCAAIRLARFNVSNEHGEQHHFSFLGLPSPGAASVIAGFVLIQQDLSEPMFKLGVQVHPALEHVAFALIWVLPPIVLGTGLLMVSTIRYPHLVNRYLRGRKSIERLVAALFVLLLLIIVHRYTIGIGCLLYAMWGPLSWAMARVRRRGLGAARPATT